MNKRQKLVQQQFLNNEKAVIKRLESVYTQALKDVNANIEKQMKRFDPETGDLPQSAVYQIKYQKMIQGQIEDVLNQMHTKEFLTVSDYLDTCYEDGFVGAMFDLHGQGVPLMVPIDQQAMVRAVQLDSKISQGLYTRLGEDVATLKKKITAEVSRGVVTGLSFQDVARNLGNQTKIGYNNAIRIARTEGHRVQTTATMDACYKAKERGADVVKQWDATLDARTRDSHAAIDGEIRELDEKFSNGLRYPGDPSGRPEEVINCRCALLQRARAALDASELKTLQDRAEYFGLDKTKTFADYKKIYLKSAATIANSAKVGKIILPDVKLSGYALNPSVAPDKAAAFKAALGYTMENADLLKQNIMSNIDESRFVAKGNSGYGMRYEFIMELTGVNGKKANVLTAWIQDEDRKRLVSTYVTKRKVTE